MSPFAPRIEPTGLAGARHPTHEPLPAALHFLPPAGDSRKPVRLFVERRRELIGALNSCRERLRPGALVWVSWPLRASQLPTDIAEEFVREIAHRLGFSAVKSSAASEVWSLMKLVMQPGRQDGAAAAPAGTLTLVEEGRPGRRA